MKSYHLGIGANVEIGILRDSIPFVIGTTIPFRLDINPFTLGIPLDDGNGKSTRRLPIRDDLIEECVRVRIQDHRCGYVFSGSWTGCRWEPAQCQEVGNESQKGEETHEL